MAINEDTAPLSSPQSWLPASVPATSPVEPVAHRVDFPGDETVLVEPVTASNLPGVPEPEEWLLLALAVGMLDWYIYTTRLKMQHQPNR